MSYRFRSRLLLPLTSVPSICGFSVSWGHPQCYLSIWSGRWGVVMGWERLWQTLLCLRTQSLSDSRLLGGFQCFLTLMRCTSVV